MKKYPLLTVVLALSLLAQQPQLVPKTPAGPPTTNDQSQAQPDPDQNVEPPTDVKASEQEVTREKSATASTQKAIPAGTISLAASTGKNILVVRVNGKDVKTFPVSVGTKGHPTPSGRFSIHHLVWNPAWHPPNAAWAKGKQAKPAGHPDNPMKVVKIFFQEPDYYIHGTDHEDQLGGAASHGCIRMSQDDVFELARLLQERAGSPRSPEWYAQVIDRSSTASVVLPNAVPIVIGR